MIIFKNKGLIPLEAIRVMALNVKVTESAIGTFGTGLKYALAVLLREGCTITLHRGKVRYDFTTKTQKVRGKEFDFVFMNDEQLPFTLELGKNWKPWQAFRELWCNTKDELEGTIDQVDDWGAKPKAGYTTFVVEGAAINEAFRDRYSTVLTVEPSMTLGAVEIVSAQSEVVYYRGIRAMDVPKNDRSLYTYNVISEQQLTEDRVLAQGFTIEGEIARAIMQSKDKGFLKEVLTCSDSFWEHSIDFDWPGITVSDELLEVLNTNKSILSDGAKALLGSRRVRHSVVETGRREIGLTNLQESIVNEAQEILVKAGFHVTHKKIWVDELPRNKLSERREDLDGYAYAAVVIESGARHLAVDILRNHLRLNDGRGSVEMQLSRIVLGLELPS